MLLRVLVLLAVAAAAAAAAAVAHGAAASSCAGAKCAKYEADACRNVTELATTKGYPCERHEVDTEDGFVLLMQRIRHGRGGGGGGGGGGGATAAPRPVVLLQHGLVDASHTWVLNSEEQSLAFILADAGFDVFLGNTRGNCYSWRNKGVSNTTERYWEFSSDEMARYDVVAQLEAAARISGAAKVGYVGHSQGTTQMFFALATPGAVRDRIVARLGVFVALAPTAYMSHQRSHLLTLLADLPRPLFRLVMGDHAFPRASSENFLRHYAPGTCGRGIVDELCDDAVYLLGGGCNSAAQCDEANWNVTRAPVYASHIGGASVQSVQHYTQLVLSDGLPAFDYGSPAKNRERYGTPEPPRYRLANIRNTSVPVALISGTLDNYAAPLDVARIKDELADSVVLSDIVDGYTHLDFVWGEDCYKRVYLPSVLPTLKKYLMS